VQMGGDHERGEGEGVNPLVVRTAHHCQRAQREVFNDRQNQSCHVPEVECGLGMRQLAVQLLLVLTERSKHCKQSQVKDDLKRSVVTNTKAEHILNIQRKMVRKSALIESGLSR